MSDLYKDKILEKLPEKILNVIKYYNINIDNKTSKQFIQWVFKYNKIDFFSSFYNNIIILQDNAN